MFNLFKSTTTEPSPRSQDHTWNPQTITMTPPSSPSAPSTEQVVTDQPVGLSLSLTELPGRRCVCNYAEADSAVEFVLVLHAAGAVRFVAAVD
ncbi:hypothetical protein AOCH_007209 [Aspergillus ochraceoroseus]|uniref:Uncharacterized protein n=1 Tax=Aspergillus ochraceoroseus TaxID=138278 RepID=A0A0F8UUR1_9EURO|nr:hypothetical protein AOCH_007209 [Aspergillus ochraceoroseus]